MNTTQAPERQTRFGGFIARVVAGALSHVDATPATEQTRLGRRISVTANEVLADERVQAEAERITATEVDAARSQIPDAFTLAKEGLAERPEVVSTYKYIRESLKTENETFFQRLYRPIVARMLSIGAGISSLLTVKYAERWYTGEFSDQQQNEYRDTMQKWYAIWLAHLFKPRAANVDQNNTQQNQPAQPTTNGALNTNPRTAPAAA